MLGSLEKLSGVLHTQIDGAWLAIQVENEEIIPTLVRFLAEREAAILRVNPRDYSLEDIYFTLQHKQQAGAL